MGIGTVEPDVGLGFQRGVKLLHDPVRNKGTAFTAEEREKLGLRGLLPPRVTTQERQVMRVLENLRRKPDDLARYVYLISLQDRNETLFYRVLVDHLKELMPLVYTPTVGAACQAYGVLFRRPRGLYISVEDRGRVREILDNWPHDDVQVIVVTDGERILGLGDLGADGMGIPVGKLALYTACAGIPPTQCLPITIDVGTDNESLLKDPLYVGLPHRRVRGQAYDELLDEFIDAVQNKFPQTLIQLEDFATANAFRLLHRYRDRACLFDDDIQGTAAVTLAGIYSALRIHDRPIDQCRFLFFGAGEANVGIADLVVAAMGKRGVPPEDARKRCWLFDSKGLVVAGRSGLQPHKAPYAHEHEPLSELEEAIRALQPTALVGASGVPGAFTRPVLEEMARVEDRPIVFALSNPTSKSECTARQAYEWTGGTAIFASGSPFDPVDFGGRTFVPGQCNNAYVFPGVGLGIVASGATAVTNEMFLAAAEVLAHQASPSDLHLGRLFPSLTRIRDVSAEIASAVAEVAFAKGLATVDHPADLTAAVRELMYEPHYPSYA